MANRRKTKPVKNEPSWKRRSAADVRRKRTPRSHGKGRYIIMTVILGAGLWYGGDKLLDKIKAHPMFSVQEVTVNGADYIDPEAIRELVEVEPGVNIFTVDLAEVSKNLKQAFTAEDFTVYRRLPDTIAVRVRERRPVALLNADKLIGVDAEGVPLPHIDAGYVETLPIITGISKVASLQDSTTRARLKAGLGLLDNISRNAPGVYGKISEVDVTRLSEMGISLVDNGLSVIIGEDGWDEKVKNLDSVLKQVKGRVESIRAVDIRFGEKIFVRQ